MKRIRFETAEINNRKSFRTAFDAVMDYPLWYKKNIDEWIDLVTISNRNIPQLVRFRSQQKELFAIEIIDSKKFLDRKPKVFAFLLKSVHQVNSRCIEKNGAPILSLILM